MIDDKNTFAELINELSVTHYELKGNISVEVTSLDGDESQTLVYADCYAHLIVDAVHAPKKEGKKI